MLKKISIFIFLLLIFLLPVNPVRAESDFLTDIVIEYEVNEQGKTLVKNNITIENASSYAQATNFVLNLENITPINPKAYENGRELKINTSKEDHSVKLQVDFDIPVAGIGKTRNFSIEYQDEGYFATRTGEVWEISIPRSTGDTFRIYEVKLSVPDSFGYEAYMSPHPQKIDRLTNKKIYYFGDEAKKSGISAGFGEFQIFNFSLSYHLENPIAKTTETEIAIPPDTSLQRVYYQNIEPVPANIVVDEDGNWLAKYVLKPKERLEINVTGAVQIFANSRQLLNLSAEDAISYTKPTKYWNSDNINIQELAKRFKTPVEIYNYVSKKLSYNYERVRPNVSRLGASEAISQPENAICMEYTDLFIAVARAAGIPAREINGYAYTENPKIQPLSLVADVLHSWPEYWDETQQIWLSVDPTWGSTTGGVDYFTKLDLRHFTFVIHGRDDSKPYPPGSYKLGSNPQKDVFITVGTLPKDRKGKLEIITSEEGPSLFNKNIHLRIVNTGTSALYNINPYIYLDEKSSGSDPIYVLPPYSIYETSITIPYGFLGLKAPSKVRIVAETAELSIPINKGRMIISQLICLFLLLLAIIILLHLKTTILSLNKIIRKYAPKKN